LDVSILSQIPEHTCLKGKPLPFLFSGTAEGPLTCMEIQLVIFVSNHLKDGFTSTFLSDDTTLTARASAGILSIARAPASSSGSQTQQLLLTLFLLIF
jgi:hypothetical protein